MSQTEAEKQFHTSSAFVLPSGHTAWQIKNDYPRSSDMPPSEVKPWLGVDFRTDPKEYCNLLKEYIFQGNTENDFVVQKNTVRSWYHPPWLHWGPRGREPLNGFTFGGYLEKGYLAEGQKQTAQGWLCSYFNWEAATILGDMWHDPNNPKWDKHLDFPIGSVICELIFCDVVPDQVPIAKWAPKFEACVGTIPPDRRPGDETPPQRPGGVGVVKTLYLVQADFVARDSRSPIGWVFGTYACDGREQVSNSWDNVFPIGLQWGNDPELLQKQYDEEKRPVQLWKNPVAMELVDVLKGDRPWLGWHERLNGLADDFMGTCTSCHATAQLNPPYRDRTPLIQDPIPQLKDGKWVQGYEEVERIWFRNLPHGTPFDNDSLSADYNLHAEFAYRNFLEWKEKREHKWIPKFFSH